MQNTSRSSERAPAAWTGAPRLMKKWLGRQCAMESMMNLASGLTLLILGVVALAFTSLLTAGVVVFLVFEINALLASFGFPFTLFRPALFVVLFLFFLVLSV